MHEAFEFPGKICDALGTATTPGSSASKIASCAKVWGIKISFAKHIDNGILFSISLATSSWVHHCDQRILLPCARPPQNIVVTQKCPAFLGRQNEYAHVPLSSVDPVASVLVMSMWKTQDQSSWGAIWPLSPPSPSLIGLVGFTNFWLDPGGFGPIKTFVSSSAFYSLKTICICICILRGILIARTLTNIDDESSEQLTYSSKHLNNNINSHCKFRLLLSKVRTNDVCVQ